MPTEKTTAERHRALGAVLILILGLMFYGLGLGPAVWLHEHTSLPWLKSGIQTVYWPLETLTKQFLPNAVDDAVMRYIELWR